MIIDQQYNRQYKRRVRIEGKPDEMHGYKLTIHDIETGKQIMNVMGVAIYLSPGEMNVADLTYVRTNAKGRLEHDPDHSFEPIIETVRVDNPEIAISAYEREKEDQE